MKIVIIGGTGLIGSQMLPELEAHGHDVVAASPQTGVNALTGEGLAPALAGAEVLVDVSNSPSFADDDVMEFFRTGTTNLVRAARQAGVGHYVALSVVGAERLPDSGYLRAKVAQERLIRDSGLRFSIVHATQFYEFVRPIADSATVDGVVRLPSALFQPMASRDVAAAVVRVVLGAPLDGVLEIGGPEPVGMADLVAKALANAGDPRPVHADPHARYFGTEVDDTSLVPGPDAELATTTYDEWSAA